MYLIRPKVEIIDELSDNEILKKIELIGRVCYKSEKRINEESARKFVEDRVKDGHEGLLEHVVMTVRFTVDRGISHELVRHRLASFAQESTRYCDYSKGDIGFIIPNWIEELEEGKYDTLVDERLSGLSDDARKWIEAMLLAERVYRSLRKSGWTPQRARSVLPMSLKTELIMTANLREWKYVLKLRTGKGVHEQMMQIMTMLKNELSKRYLILATIIT